MVGPSVCRIKRMLVASLLDFLSGFRVSVSLLFAGRKNAKSKGRRSVSCIFGATLFLSLLSSCVCMQILHLQFFSEVLE